MNAQEKCLNIYTTYLPPPRPPVQDKSSWTKHKNLTLNPDKTTCTMFTPETAEYTSNLDLKMNNIQVQCQEMTPMATRPKVLGLTLDLQLTYRTHIHNISVHAPKPLQIIKALTTTGWGKQKETLMATYKAVMRLALEYASSIWLLSTHFLDPCLWGGSPIIPLLVHQQLISPSGQHLHHTSGICPQIQG